MTNPTGRKYCLKIMKNFAKNKTNIQYTNIQDSKIYLMI